MRRHPVIAVVLTLGLLTGAASAAIIEEVVVNVNGDIITRTDVEKREREVQESLHQRYSGAELDKAIADFRKNILVDMINEKLLYQRAVRMGLDLEQVYKSSVDSIMQQNKITTSEELKKIIESQGLTVQEFRQSVLQFNVPDIMINMEVRRRIAVAPSEVEAYYKANEKMFSKPTTFTFRELAILLADRSKEEAIALADEIIKKSAAGEDFMALVKEYSEAPSRERAGLVESMTSEDMSDAIRDAVVALKPGEISPPIVTSRAVLVIKLEDMVPASVESLEEASPQIEAFLQQKQFRAKLKEYLEGLWVDSFIEVMPKYKERYPIERPDDTHEDS